MDREQHWLLTLPTLSTLRHQGEWSEQDEIFRPPAGSPKAIASVFVCNKQGSQQLLFSVRIHGDERANLWDLVRKFEQRLSNQRPAGNAH